MKKIILAPDSFKGSLSAIEVCQSLEKGIRTKYAEAEIIQIPMADGGEGSLEAIDYVLQAEKIRQYVKDPLWRTTEAFYLRKGDTAYIEMAQAAGLHRVKESQRDPELATTYGTGQQIKHAVKNGVRKVYLFVGGSATNDGGIGIAQACGYKFYDADDTELLTGGEALAQIERIQLPENPLEFELFVVCDVTNPLYGENGAAYVYGPQKGADEAMVKRLDIGLQNFARVLKDQLGKEVATIPGAGAAGGVPAGMLAFFDAQILPGVQTVMEIVNLEGYLGNADLIITGEGKLDSQTLSGKLIAGVARLGKEHSVPVYAVCGKNELSELQLNELGIEKVASLVNENTPTERAISEAAVLLEERIKSIL